MQKQQPSELKAGWRCPKDECLASRPAAGGEESISGRIQGRGGCVGEGVSVSPHLRREALTALFHQDTSFSLCPCCAITETFSFCPGLELLSAVSCEGEGFQWKRREKKKKKKRKR